MASKPIGGERAISPKILEILDLPPDVTEDDCLPRVELLKFRKGRIEEFVREEIKRKVNTAITPDRDGISKIYGHEREEKNDRARPRLWSRCFGKIY